MQLAGAAALLPATTIDSEAAQVPAAPKEGPGTPKIAISTGDAGLFAGPGGAPAGGPPADRSSAPKRVKQLGVNYVLGGGGRLPWTVEALQATMAPWKAEGITVGNLMINLI